MSHQVKYCIPYFTNPYYRPHNYVVPVDKCAIL